MRSLVHAVVSLILLPMQIFFMVFGTILHGIFSIVALPFHLIGMVLAFMFHITLVGLQFVLLIATAGLMAAIVIGGLLLYNNSSHTQIVDLLHGRAELASAFADTFEVESCCDSDQGGQLAVATDSEDEDSNATVVQTGEDQSGPVIVRMSQRKKSQSRTADAESNESTTARSKSYSIVIGGTKVFTSGGEVAEDDEGGGDESHAKSTAASVGEIAADAAFDSSTNPPSSEATVSDESTASIPSDERPLWVDEHEDNLHDGMHRVRAECGPCETPQECRREMPLRIREATHSYVLKQVHSWMGANPFSDWMAQQWTTDALRRRKIEPTKIYADVHETKLGETVSETHFLYGLLEFDAHFRDRLRRDMQSYVRSARLGSYWVSTILGVGGLAVWFRGFSATKATLLKPPTRRYLARGGASLIWITAGIVGMASAAWIPWL